VKAYAAAKLSAGGVPLEFSTEGQSVKPGDAVVVATPAGERVAQVVADVPPACSSCSGCALKKTFPKLTRMANPEDQRQAALKQERESEAYRSCLLKIKEHSLPMKLVKVDYEMDGSRATFYFTAEERVDFRALVRELAHEFRTRIEMRQVGPRDAAGMLGGYGTCGRPLCCSTFLKKFRPISIKMAKKQNITLNPSKLSGLCGRLKCCLAYEYD
jgi:cell fate regulator YaaT (PSP1 superfamily)